LGNVLRKHRAIPRAKQGLAVVLDEHRFTVEHYDELVDPFVPVALAGDSARLEHDMADADIGQAAGRSQPPETPPPHLRRERHRVAGPVGLLHRFEIDLRHPVLLAANRAVRNCRGWRA
jgi:hypothetical protein